MRQKRGPPVENRAQLQHSTFTTLMSGSLLWSVRGLAVAEVFGDRGAGELLTQQTCKDHHRLEWPVASHNMLRLAGGVTGDKDDTTNRVTVNLGNVVFDEPVVAVGTGELELLMLVQRA